MVTRQGTPDAALYAVQFDASRRQGGRYARVDGAVQHRRHRAALHLRRRSDRCSVLPNALLLRRPFRHPIVRPCQARHYGRLRCHARISIDTMTPRYALEPRQIPCVRCATTGCVWVVQLDTHQQVSIVDLLRYFRNLEDIVACASRSM